MQGGFEAPYDVFKASVGGLSLFLKSADEAAAFSASIVPPFSIVSTVCNCRMSGLSHPQTVAKAQITHGRTEFGDATVNAMQAVALPIRRWSLEPHGAQGIDFLAAQLGSQQVKLLPC